MMALYYDYSVGLVIDWYIGFGFYVYRHGRFILFLFFGGDIFPMHDLQTIQ